MSTNNLQTRSWIGRRFGHIIQCCLSEQWISELPDLAPTKPVLLELGISQFFYDWKNKQDDIAGCRCLIWPNTCELSPTAATGHSCKKTNPIQIAVSAMRCGSHILPWRNQGTVHAEECRKTDEPERSAFS